MLNSATLLRSLVSFCLVSEFFLPSVALGAGQRLNTILNRTSPDGQGLVHSYEFIDALSQAQKEVKRTPAAEGAFQLLEHSIEKLNFDPLLNDPLGQAVEPNTRLYLLQGRIAEKSYFIDLSTQAEVSPEDLVSPLSFSQAWYVKRHQDPLPDESRGLGIKAKGKLRLGSVSHHTALVILTGLLQRAVPMKQSQEEDGIYSELRRSLPKSMSELERYVSIQPLYLEKHSSSQDYLEVHMNFRLLLESLSHDYPALGTYVRRITENLSPQGQLYWNNPDGQRLAYIQFDGSSKQLDLRFLLKEGSLVPADEKGNPVFSKKIDLTKMSDFASVLSLDLKAQLLGLQLQIPQITSHWTYQDQSAAQLKIKLVSNARPKITGSLGGFLPTWAIDTFIPGSLESHAETFFRGLLEANGQEPAALTIKVRRDHFGYLASAQGELVLIENNFLLLGLRTVQAQLWPQENVRTEIRDLARSQTTALHSDFVNLLRLEKAVPMALQ